MGENTKIEWCDHTFNPWQGCAKVSAGCANCYAEAMMDKRLGKVQWGDAGTRVRTSAANWKKPLQWNRQGMVCIDCGTPVTDNDCDCGQVGAIGKMRRPRVFCASLADVFEDRPELYQWRIDLMNLINQTPNLDWLLLTKRPENVMQMLSEIGSGEDGEIGLLEMDWPMPNVWIGTSVENQEQADKRIPELLKIPAKVRFLSMEPLLGPVDMDNYIRPLLPLPIEEAPSTWAEWNSRDLWPHWVPEKWRRLIENFHNESWGRSPNSWLQGTLTNGCPPFGATMTCDDCIGKKGVTITGRFVHTWNNMCILVDSIGEAHVTSTPRRHLFDPGPSSGSYQRINWVICGGESGPNARPMHPDWARSLRDQCQAAGVPFHFKQWGEWAPDCTPPVKDSHRWPICDGQPRGGVWSYRVGKHAAGRTLDSRTWDQFPEVYP